MIAVLYIITTLVGNPQVATANPQFNFTSMEECNAKATELNKTFQSTQKPYAAGCYALSIGEEFGAGFRAGARMGAYSTIKKYQYCLIDAQTNKDLPLKEKFDDCTRIISEDIEAIWPKTE